MSDLIILNRKSWEARNGVAPTESSMIGNLSKGRQMQETPVEYIRDLPGTSNITFEPSVYLRDLIFEPPKDRVAIEPFDTSNLIDNLIQHAGPSHRIHTTSFSHDTTNPMAPMAKPTLIISRSLFNTDNNPKLPQDDPETGNLGLLPAYQGYDGDLPIYEGEGSAERKHKKKKKKHKHEYDYIDENGEPRRKKKRKKDKETGESEEHH
ncbi:hypothetical protein H4R33_006490 [Dimargaris cristalligena]|nr:hypothetical protein H4R33_006490 [Dimargaris cristalligena]